MRSTDVLQRDDTLVGYGIRSPQFPLLAVIGRCDSCCETVSSQTIAFSFSPHTITILLSTRCCRNASALLAATWHMHCSSRFMNSQATTLLTAWKDEG